MVVELAVPSGTARGKGIQKSCLKIYKNHKYKNKKNKKMINNSKKSTGRRRKKSQNLLKIGERFQKTRKNRTEKPNREYGFFPFPK